MPSRGPLSFLRKPLVQMVLFGTLGSVVGTLLVFAINWFPEQASTEAEELDTLYYVLMAASVPIFFLVMTIVIFSVIRFRARPGDMRDGAHIHGSVKLEVVWIAVPTIIVTALAVYGYTVLVDVEKRQSDAMVVKVNGQQFDWNFEYSDGAKPVKSERLVLPTGKQIEFRITTSDVLHSFWVPEFRLKKDAVPGQTTTVRMTPNKVGEYQIVCAELCGLGHGTMRQAVQVVPPEEFREFLAKEQGGAAGAQAEADEPEGEQVFTEAGCGACHVLAKAGGTGSVGPSLDELAGVAGKRKPGKSAEEYVRESIVDPGAFVVEDFPGGTMPADYEKRLEPGEIDALVKLILGGEGR